MISHVRRQHPVGQGLFHSAEVDFNATRPRGVPWGWPFLAPLDVPDQPTAMRYIYDCGATGGDDAREREIDSVIDRYGVHATLDFVFLSHADADHINGLPRLLDPDSGLHAATVIMPNISVFERLATWAATAVAGNAQLDAGDPYSRFVIDPVGALKGEFGSARVILVGEGDGRLDEGEARTLGPEDDDPGRDRDFTWQMAGVTESFEGGQSTFHAPSGTPVIVGSRVQPGSDWILLPHVASKTVNRLADFEAELARLLGITPAELASRLRDVDEVAKILREHSAELAKAYSATVPSVNGSTLSLYSGPVPGAHLTGSQLVVGDGTRPDRRFLYSGPAGWLGTGDAELHRAGYLAELLTTMSDVLDDVGVITVPHHGSGALNNRIPALWDAFDRLHTCVTSADPPSNWDHPATSIVIDIASRGLHHVIVTRDQRSALTEWILVELKQKGRPVLTHRDGPSFAVAATCWRP